MAYNTETGLWEGFIYIIENDVDENIYIGQTIRNIEERFQEHIKDSKNIYNQKHIHKAINKYGETHFQIRELLKVQNNNKKTVEDDLDIFEQYYIEKYNCVYGAGGYNGTNGGHNHVSVKKPVDQYNIDGMLLNTYNSIVEASFITKCSRSNISNACKGKHFTCGGYIWRYHNEDFNKYPILNQLKDYSIIKREVNCYSLSNQYIKTYNSLQEAADSVGLKNSYNITNVCMKRRKKAGGYIWYYIDDESQPDKSKIVRG